MFSEKEQVRKETIFLWIVQKMFILLMWWEFLANWRSLKEQRWHCSRNWWPNNEFWLPRSLEKKERLWDWKTAPHEQTSGTEIFVVDLWVHAWELRDFHQDHSWMVAYMDIDHMSRPHFLIIFRNCYLTIFQLLKTFEVTSFILLGKFPSILNQRTFK